MESPDDLKSWYEFVFGVTPSPVTLRYCVGACFSLFFLIKLIWGDVKNSYQKNKKIKAILADYGSEYTGRFHERIYIPARFQSVPPEFSLDLSESVRSIASQDLIDFYIKQALVENNTDKHWYLILGGSGMGKSSFVVQLVKQYYRKHIWGKEPYELVLIPGGSANIINRISQTPNKTGAVLILDALDECRDAISDFNTFILAIEPAIQEFRHVIITCRTQFFEGSAAIRRESIIPVQSMEKGVLQYDHQYMAPFTDQEIHKYLKRRYLFHLKRRRLAERIVKQNSLLMVRPLLLSYIDDLVHSDGSLSRKADVYHELINRWIKREANFEPDPRKRDNISQAIYEISIELAVKIYQNWMTNGELFLPYSEYVALEQQFTQPQGISFHYRGRSLINWDIAGNRKFAHKSFLEYFLAVKMINDASFSVNSNELDDVNGFYSDMCDSLLNKEQKEKRIIIWVDESPYLRFTYMSILGQPHCEYRHLMRKPDMLVIDWDMMSLDFFNWLNTVSAGFLVIKNYRRGAFATDLPNLNGLETVLFYQSVDPPSQRIQKDLNRKRINYTISSDKWNEKQYKVVYLTNVLSRRRAAWLTTNNK